MDLAPARLCARECLDCALQRAVRPRRARHRHLTRIRARRKRSRRLSKRSDALDYSKRLAGERSSHPEHCAYFIEPRITGVKRLGTSTGLTVPLGGAFSE